MLSEIIQRSWYRQTGLVTLLLLPFSFLFCIIVSVRRILYRAGIFRQQQLSVPVIVIGNITVGGTGKTPLVAAVAAHLVKKGYRPGIVSRGYGGKTRHWPQMVTGSSNPLEVGDEAVLLANITGCPVCVDPDRAGAGEKLIKESACDIIVADDGLQHLALGRDIEIVVIDGSRRLGNQLCLPAGPLRESASRLNKADMIVSNGDAISNEFSMQLTPGEFVSLNDDSVSCVLTSFADRTVHAVSGIGNNERFFDTLEQLGVKIIRHPFPDHYSFQKNDLQFNDDLPIIMTAKDAVKCQTFIVPEAWYLKVSAELSHKFYLRLDEKILGLRE